MNQRLTPGRLLAIALALGVVAGLLPTGGASAAELPSSGTSDELRCVQASFSGRFVAKCYGDVGAYGFDWSAAEGSVVSLDNLTNTPRNYAITSVYVLNESTSAQVWRNGLVSMCHNGAVSSLDAEPYKLYVGPLDDDPVVGDLPAGALVIVCDTAFSVTESGVTYTPAPDPSSSTVSSYAVAYCTSTNTTTCNGRNHILVGNTPMSYLGAFPTLADVLAEPWPVDWFPGGEEAGPPLEGCARLSFSGPSGSQVWRRGVPLSFTVSWEPGNAPSMLWLRFPLSGVLSQWADGTTLTFGSGPVEVPPGFVPYQLATVSNVSKPSSSEWTFDGTESITIDQLGPDTTASELTAMCIFNDAEGVQFGFHRWSGDSTSTVPAPRECSLLGIARPDAANAEDEFVVLFHAGINSGEADVGPVSVERWDGVEWDEVFSDVTFGADDPAVAYTLPSLGQSVEDLRFRCEDADGYLEGGRITGGPGYVGINVGDDGFFCTVGNVGINPVSWLPAAGRLAGCVVRWIFVPTPDQLEGASNMWDDTFLARFSAPVTSTVAGFASLGTLGTGSCNGPVVALDFGSDMSGSAPLSLSPLNACDTDEGNRAMAYARTVTWWGSRFLAMLWIVFRFRNLYFSAVAPR